MMRVGIRDLRRKLKVQREKESNLYRIHLRYISVTYIYIPLINV